MAVAKMRSLAQLSPSSSAVQRTASAPLARRAQAITTTPRFTPILPRVGAISVSHCSSVKRAGSRAAQHTVHITAASASSPGVLSDPSGDAPTEGESDGGQGRLPPATQAICYAAGAGVLCLWWLWSSSYGAAGALFAAATVAAKPASIVMAAQSAWAGLLAGCLHTLAGADHLAALTPLTIGRSRASSAILGGLWGAGHSTGQLFLGLLMVLLKDRFDALMPALSKWGGTLVGLTLLAIGFMGIYEAYFDKHDDEEHDDEVAAIDEKVKSGKSFAAATYATGIVYGLQPDALFVIIPALALPTKSLFHSVVLANLCTAKQMAAAAYILMFVIGTCVAMGSYTAVIGHTTEAISEKSPWVTQNLTLFASLIAITVGTLVLLPGWGVNIPFSPF